MPALQFHDAQLDLENYMTPVRAYRLSCNNRLIYQEHLLRFDAETGECLGEDPLTHAGCVVALARCLGILPDDARELLDTIAHHLDRSPLLARAA